MRKYFDQESKKSIFIYTFSALLIILMFKLVFNFSAVTDVFSIIGGLILPFFIGLGFAFLLNKPLMYFDKLLSKFIPQKFVRGLSAIIVTTLAVGAIALFFVLTLPEVLNSLQSLIDNLDVYAVKLKQLYDDLITNSDMIDDSIKEYMDGLNIVGNITDAASKILPQIMDIAFKFVKVIFNIFVGLFAGVYLMLDKERFLRYLNRVNNAIFNKRKSTYLRSVGIRTGLIFNDFIVGKSIDSFIIGCLSYLGMLVLNLPYAVLLSVIVGITNMIPVFGPFIGAIPGILILLLIDPALTIIYAIFILVLQQLDGNVIGPLILGDKLGIPSFCILFSVVIGGGLFGFFGMFLGVPMFALIFSIFNDYVKHKEEQNELELSEE